MGMVLYKIISTDTRRIIHIILQQYIQFLLLSESHLYATRVEYLYINFEKTGLWRRYNNI